MRAAAYPRVWRSLRGGSYTAGVRAVGTAPRVPVKLAACKTLASSFLSMSLALNSRANHTRGDSHTYLSFGKGLSHCPVLSARTAASNRRELTMESPLSTLPPISAVLSPSPPESDGTESTASSQPYDEDALDALMGRCEHLSARRRLRARAAAAAARRRDVIERTGDDSVASSVTNDFPAPEPVEMPPKSGNGGRRGRAASTRATPPASRAARPGLSPHRGGGCLKRVQRPCCCSQ